MSYVKIMAWAFVMINVRTHSNNCGLSLISSKPQQHLASETQDTRGESCQTGENEFLEKQNKTAWLRNLTEEPPKWNK